LFVVDTDSKTITPVTKSSLNTWLALVGQAGKSIRRRGRFIRKQQFTRTAAMVALGLVLLLAPIGAGITAIALAPAAQVNDVGLDGLDARIDLRIGSNAMEINSGLLGGIRNEGPAILGKRIGLDIQPSDVGLTLLDRNGSLDPAATAVIGHLISDPLARADELHRLTRQVTDYYQTVGFGSVYLVAMLEIFGYMYLKHRRRVNVGLTPSERQRLHSDRRTDRILASSIVLVAVVLVLVPGVYVVSPLSDNRVAITADPALSGTFLDGWQISGPFKSLIIQAIDAVDAYGKQEQAFYDKVSANLQTQFENSYRTQSLPKESNVVRYVLLDDLQGTSGMARIVGEAAHHYNANAILNLGDLTATGTKQEAYLSYLKSYTIDVLANRAYDIPVYVTLGRHDTPAVETYLKKVHITVANGKLQDIAGIPSIGTNSPYVVDFGEAARLTDPDITTRTVAEGLRDEACIRSPAIVYSHDSELLNEVASSGCVPIVIGGHDFAGKPVQNLKTGSNVTRKLTLGSTGGHGSGDGIGGLSTPRNNAPFVMLSIDKKTGSLSVDTITVKPDASVTMSTTFLTPLSSKQLARF
jgi:hypothetical protein